MDISVTQKLAKKITDGWTTKTPIYEILTVARLAFFGLLGPIEKLMLCNVNLSKISNQLLNSLIALIDTRLEIRNVTRIDFMEIMNNVYCRCLHIDFQYLDWGDTLMLVDSLYSTVEILEIGVWRHGDIIVELSSLMRYDGSGRCKVIAIKCEWDCTDSVRRKMRSWSQKINWNVLCEGMFCFVIGRTNSMYDVNHFLH